jgi:hypothetical protein
MDVAQKAQRGKKAEGNGEGEEPAEASKPESQSAARFQIPEGYFETYLQSGRADGEPPNWNAIVAERAGEPLSKEFGPGFDKSFAEWLYERYLQQFLTEHQEPATHEQQAPLLEQLTRLSPFDREMLRAFVVERGHDAQVVRALGPEGMKLLDGAPPPPRPPVVQDEKEKDKKKNEKPEDEAKKDAKPAGDDEKKPEGDDQKQEGESKGQFVGDTLFDKLFGPVLRDKKLPAGPEPILQELQPLDDVAWDQLSRMTDERNAWDTLALLVGPPLEALVAAKRLAPLERLVAAHEDGICPPDEQNRHLGVLELLGPFEKRHLLTALVGRGMAKKLVPLLGERFLVWAGGEFVEPPPPPVEDPEAAMAALRPLPVPVQRRIMVALQKGAAGPALTEALGSELDPFTQAYHDAVPKPEPKGKRLPKPALEALRRVSADELKKILPPDETEKKEGGEGEGAAPEPTELPPGGTDVKLSALLKPLVAGRVLSPQQREQALQMFAGMSERELVPILSRLTVDELAQLEAGLGPLFRRTLQNTFYQPLQRAMDELGTDPPAEARAHLAAPLLEMSPWTLDLLRERIAVENSGERLAVLLGTVPPEGLRRALGLQDPPGVPPPPAPSLLLTPQQRKALAKVLADTSPGEFTPLLADTRPDVVRRFAGAAGDDLGAALLALLPPEDATPPPPLPEPIEVVQLAQLFERVAAQLGGDDDDPKKPPGQAPRKKKKRDDEPMHDNLELDPLYQELFGQELDPGDDVKPDTARPRADKFAGLPDPVKRSLIQRLRGEGAFERVKKALGDAFVAAVPHDGDYD